MQEPKGLAKESLGRSGIEAQKETGIRVNFDKKMPVIGGDSARFVSNSCFLRPSMLFRF